MNKYDAVHQRNLRRYQKQIDKIYDTAVKEAALIAGLVHGLGDDKLFSFSDYPLTQRRITDLLNMLAREIEVAIVNGVRSEWTLANNKNNALCDRVFGDHKASLTKEEQRRYYSNNDRALKAFMERKESGLSLSDRVWRYTDLFKHEIELGIDVGIRSGKSAALMARDLKQFLKFPDKLFRRVRDEHGMLKLSQAAKAFHPGRGVYRSSYKNARRLAATETNMAYRTADHDRWQDLDFVVGQEIKLSGNHTCLGADGKPHPFYDICDELKGKYPKDFKFVGWHPHCRCFSVPVMKSMEEIKADTQRILRGEEVSSESHNTVKDLPNNFKDWIEDNAERTARAKSLPYFIRDNQERVDKILDAYPRKIEISQVEEASHKARHIAGIIVSNGGHANREAQMPPLYIGQTNEALNSFANRNGIILKSHEIYITTKGIEHSLRESKTAKGISVSQEEIADFIINKNNYTLYYDPVKGDFVFTTEKAKFVVRPNYKLRIDKRNKEVLNYITATRLKGNISDNFSSYIKIRDAMQ